MAGERRGGDDVGLHASISCLMCCRIILLYSSIAFHITWWPIDLITSRAVTTENPWCDNIRYKLPWRRIFWQSLRTKRQRNFVLWRSQVSRVPRRVQPIQYSRTCMETWTGISENRNSYQTSKMRVNLPLSRSTAKYLKEPDRKQHGSRKEPLTRVTIFRLWTRKELLPTWYLICSTAAGMILLHVATPGYGNGAVGAVRGASCHAS